MLERLEEVEVLYPPTAPELESENTFLVQQGDFVSREGEIESSRFKSVDKVVTKLHFQHRCESIIESHLKARTCNFVLGLRPTGLFCDHYCLSPSINESRALARS